MHEMCDIVCINYHSVWSGVIRSLAIVHGPHVPFTPMPQAHCRLRVLCRQDRCTVHIDHLVLHCHCASWALVCGQVKEEMPHVVENGGVSDPLDFFAALGVAIADEEVPFEIEWSEDEGIVNDGTGSLCTPQKRPRVSAAGSSVGSTASSSARESKPTPPQVSEVITTPEPQSGRSSMESGTPQRSVSSLSGTPPVAASGGVPAGAAASRDIADTLSRALSHFYDFFSHWRRRRRQQWEEEECSQRSNRPEDLCHHAETLSVLLHP